MTTNHTDIAALLKSVVEKAYREGWQAGVDAHRQALTEQWPQIVADIEAKAAPQAVIRAEIPGLGDILRELADRSGLQSVEVVKLPNRIHTLSRDQRGKPIGAFEEDIA